MAARSRRARRRGSSHHAPHDAAHLQRRAGVRRERRVGRAQRVAGRGAARSGCWCRSGDRSAQGFKAPIEHARPTGGGVAAFKLEQRGGNVAADAGVALARHGSRRGSGDRQRRSSSRMRPARMRRRSMPDKAWDEPGGPVYGGGLSSGPVRRIPGSRRAALYALDAQTGKELWSSGTQIESWNHFSGLTVANGRAYIATFDGVLYCFGIAAVRREDNVMRARQLCARVRRLPGWPEASRSRRSAAAARSGWRALGDAQRTSWVRTDDKISVQSAVEARLRAAVESEARQPAAWRDTGSDRASPPAA